MYITKTLLIFLGTLSLGIGCIGIFIPGLPTTPFLLITAGLYLRSSDKLYQKVISNRFIGSYINDFQTKKGMTLKIKLYSITLMWLMISSSCIFFISVGLVRLVLIVVGLIGTFVMGFLIQTIKHN